MLGETGSPLNADLAIDVILQSLPPSYKQFIMNFHMNSMEKTLSKLHGMLKTAEESIKLNANHVNRVSSPFRFRRRTKKGSIGRLPKAKARKRKRFPRSSRALSLRPKLAPLPMMNASTARARDFGQETAKNIWRI